MKLFEPGRIGTLTLKNRIVMAPMNTIGLVETNGRLSRRGIEYYAARARGGTGLLISSVTKVEDKIEALPSAPFSSAHKIDDYYYTSGLSELADAVHDHGAKIAIQLTAGIGRNVGRLHLSTVGAVAPSAVPCFWDSSYTTRELKTEEVEQIVKAFGVAAEIVRLAGIDAIELHGHEGYLMDEFMTALWNKRTDKYGGDLEGRLRFAMEVIQSVRKGAGEDFPLIYRYGGNHYIKGGRELEETLEIAKRLEKAGVDCLHIDAGCYEAYHWAHPPMYQPPGCLVDLAAAVKKAVQIPVIAVGKLGYPDLAESVLREGKADFIGLGRPLLADPDWPNKVKEGRTEDILMCIGCHEGCLLRESERKYLSCAVNPLTGMERELALSPAKKQKSVLVVGGGPAGMEAARVAALKGHKVTLWEKENGLGGNLIPAVVPDFKQDLQYLIDYLSTQIKKLGVTVELGREGTPELIKAKKPDVVIIATGSVPIVPEFPGGQKGNVITAVDLLLGKRDAEEYAVVAGGGEVGCETAVYLARKGKKVIVVEAMEDVIRGICWANKQQLLEMLADAGVEVLTDTVISEITTEGVITIDKNGKCTPRKADTVVVAVGHKPENKLIDALSDDVLEVYAVGDCVNPRVILNAIWEGYRTARLV
ncbi:FAD-dependent oxidoreductase [Chloroflexota bacterium]